MSQVFLRCMGLAITLTVLHVGLSRGDDQVAVRNIFERARKISNMKEPGRPGFHLSGEVRIWLKKDTASQGKYLFISTPEGRWREEIVFGGYKRVRSGDGKQFWQTRTSDVENEHIIELDTLLGLGRLFMFRVEDNDKLRRLPAANIGGIDADCIRDVSANGYARTFCFNATSGELIRYTPSDLPWRFVWEDYSQFQQWGDGRFPRTLHGLNGKNMVVEVQLEEIGPLSPVPKDFFDPPAGSTIWSDCTAGEIWKLKDKVQPEYPHSARINRIAGTVTLGAVIEDDGRVSNLRVMHSAGTELDQAAGKAVSGWRYKRTTACQGSVGRSETTIDVIFSLN